MTAKRKIKVHPAPKKSYRKIRIALRKAGKYSRLVKGKSQRT